jgi:hypothetical protein
LFAILVRFPLNKGSVEEGRAWRLGNKHFTRIKPWR